MVSQHEAALDFQAADIIYERRQLASVLSIYSVAALASAAMQLVEVLGQNEAIVTEFRLAIPAVCTSELFLPMACRKR